jgi:hypothetical protein
VDDVTNDEKSVSAATSPTDNDGELDNPTHDAAEAEIIAEGCAAMDRIAEDREWKDWVKIGRLVDMVRVAAMAKASCNTHNGKKYAEAFAKLTKEKGVDQLNDERRVSKTERSRLYKCIANLEAIERWRATLTDPPRRRLNHPESVWKKYEKAIKPPKPKRSDEEETPRKQLKSNLAAALDAQHKAETALKQIMLDFDDVEEMAAAAAKRLGSAKRWREMAAALNAKADEMESAS